MSNVIKMDGKTFLIWFIGLIMIMLSVVASYSYHVIFMVIGIIGTIILSFMALDGECGFK